MAAVIVLGIRGSKDGQFSVRRKGLGQFGGLVRDLEGSVREL